MHKLCVDATVGHGFQGWTWILPNVWSAGHFIAANPLCFYSFGIGISSDAIEMRLLSTFVV